MGGIGGAVDLGALQFLVDGVLLADRTPRISPLAPSTSAASSPSWMAPASSSSAERVIGIGQNRPSESLMSTQAPRQSAAPMKPSSGV
jgi:hypothetical protein